MEHVGDSDDGDSGGTPDEVDAIAPPESHPPRRLFCAAGNVKVQAECLVMKRGKCWGTWRLRTKLIVPWTFCECGRRHNEARHCAPEASVPPLFC